MLLAFPSLSEDRVAESVAAVSLFKAHMTPEQVPTNAPPLGKKTPE